MAITAEQAAAISTAIENLNKSVQVNEEVLQIIKSMQSTGAAGSVAEHAANVHAHEQLDRFVVPNVFFVGQDRAYVDDKAAMRFGTAKDDANSSVQISMYSVAGELDTQPTYPAILSYVKNNASGSRAQTNLFSIRCSTLDYNNTEAGYERSIEMYFRKGKSENNTIDFTFEDNKTVHRLKLSGSSFRPLDTSDLGSSVNQWQDIYLKNSPIVSSDRRLKQDIANIPEAVFRAWEKVNFCQYRFKEAVEKKGSEARLHVGMIAQEILEAFNSQGLNATDYGIVCHDSWEDQYQDVEVGTKPAVLNEKGEVVTPEEPIMEPQLIKKAGDLWTVRYEEALALEAAYQRWKLQKIEAALAEKGISL